MQITKTVTH